MVALRRPRKNNTFGSKDSEVIFAVAAFQVLVGLPGGKIKWLMGTGI